MKALIVSLILLTINFETKADLSERHVGVNDEVIKTLLSQRSLIDTLFSHQELMQIENIKQSLTGQITTSNVDDILRSYYHKFMPILNSHKRKLQEISKQLLKECLNAYVEKSNKKDMKRLEFITSPLPLILLVDERFINLFEF